MWDLAKSGGTKFGLYSTLFPEPIIPHLLTCFHRTSLERPYTRHSKIEYKSDSAVLLRDGKCGWGRTSLGNAYRCMSSFISPLNSI